MKKLIIILIGVLMFGALSAQYENSYKYVIKTKGGITNTLKGLDADKIDSTKVSGGEYKAYQGATQLNPNVPAAFQVDGSTVYVTRLADTTAVTDHYTLILTDAGNDVMVTKASQVIITIPTNASVAFPVGTKINFFMTGAGIVTFSGNTYSANDSTTINTRYGGATLIKRGADNWLIIGALQD